MKDNIIDQSWEIIAPFWPLKNIIAVNPLKGLENFTFEDAIAKGYSYFKIENPPIEIENINRETIKWLQVFLDEGQTKIAMPMREQGLYKAWKQLSIFDSNLHNNDKTKIEFLQKLPDSPKDLINKCLDLLEIQESERIEFLQLLLTTLPGWASYIKYKTQWEKLELGLEVQEEYLAFRLTITYLLWPKAKDLLKARTISDNQAIIEKIEQNENQYRTSLLNKLISQKKIKQKKPDAQIVFCIDVRSEPFRYFLEQVGNYETFGFAGFFCLPIKVENTQTKECYNSCPVLVEPKHSIKETPFYSNKTETFLEVNKNIKLFYQSLKYNFTTPLALAESIGAFSGILMIIRNFFPKVADSVLYPKDNNNFDISIQNIPLIERAIYAESALRMIGLTQNFAPIVVLCGHGSLTHNNAFASSLDCGACGGRHGGTNARILASILNDVNVRKILLQKDITIPEATVFVAAEHNTTNDEVTIYNCKDSKEINNLKTDLKKAGKKNSLRRSLLLSTKSFFDNENNTKLRSIDWSQIRPEWGLAKNAAFIIGPRSLTKNLDLEGRCFLHSYEYEQDMDGKNLTTILTAPVIVAQWINSQYLFSALDNVVFGSGSKVTKNITGKIGVMQGNASDLMTGLPLQSVNISDNDPYHDLQRLMTVVYAPKNSIKAIVSEQDILITLIKNEWIALYCIDPNDNKIYLLTRDMLWKEIL